MTYWLIDLLSIFFQSFPSMMNTIITVSNYIVSVSVWNIWIHLFILTNYDCWIFWYFVEKKKFFFSLKIMEKKNIGTCFDFQLKNTSHIIFLFMNELNFGFLFCFFLKNHIAFFFVPSLSSSFRYNGEYSIEI